MLSIISDQTNLNDSKYTLSVKVIKNREKNIDLLKFLNALPLESFSIKHGTKNDQGNLRKHAKRLSRVRLNVEQVVNLFPKYMNSAKSFPIYFNNSNCCSNMHFFKIQNYLHIIFTCMYMFDIQLNQSIPILTADESPVSNTSSIYCLNDIQFFPTRIIFFKLFKKSFSISTDSTFPISQSTKKLKSMNH